MRAIREVKDDVRANCYNEIFYYKPSSNLSSSRQYMYISKDGEDVKSKIMMFISVNQLLFSTREVFYKGIMWPKGVMWHESSD